ncbi:MAG: aminomethyl-transferring glycine dehydrogenase subunit GcvPA [Sedimentisphaerales bacterium]|nr:aminomethyl-transferring glycine dehydrogenase subunit GcvPA [Sedimentisphaerales bacterium]MBN2842111.1 aminomethyl-transferring glycine dehydrogenase subunit GcvPA [Sedimentisphaerales bacterium]
MPYISNTKQQRQEMLSFLGMTEEELFADVPAELLAKELDLPAAKSELLVTQQLTQLAAKNHSGLTCFMGGGFYDHFIPAAVNALISRSEFYTAYTPYQPEVSQGTLQAIYEFQSMICRLTDMQVSNASIYDGGTALYEAMKMAMRITKRERIIIDDSVNPIYRVMLESYTRNLNIELVTVANHDGRADRNAIAAVLDDKTAAVIVQNPNFFGLMDDFSDIADIVHAKKALLISSCYPVSLGLIKTPGAMGVDIVAGEGQSLGIPLNFGGPYLGFMAAKAEHVRNMPGRICGRTTDTKGRDGFVLTLQAREQHIRREKANSNICSNESLCALAATIYMSLLGKEGFHELAVNCYDKAAYAFDRICSIPGVKPRFENRWFFNEFVVELPRNAADVAAALIDKGFAAGFPLYRYYQGMDNTLLIAVTEKRTKTEIGMLAEALESVL